MPRRQPTYKGLPQFSVLYHRFLFNYSSPSCLPRSQPSPLSVKLSALMASEANSQTGFSFLMPLLLGFATQQQEQDSRVVLINAPAQSVVLIGAGDASALLSAKRGQPPASEAAIEAMKAVEAGEEQRSECSICLEEWETGKEMPCGHKFHGGCIERWLRIHGSCPLCRFSLPADEEEKKKREETGGVEGRILISFSFNFGGRGSESSDDSSPVPPVHEAES